MKIQSYVLINPCFYQNFRRIRTKINEFKGFFFIIYFMIFIKLFLFLQEFKSWQKLVFAHFFIYFLFWFSIFKPWSFNYTLVLVCSPFIPIYNSFKLNISLLFICLYPQITQTLTTLRKYKDLAYCHNFHPGVEFYLQTKSKF